MCQWRWWWWSHINMTNPLSLSGYIAGGEGICSHFHQIPCASYDLLITKICTTHICCGIFYQLWCPPLQVTIVLIFDNKLILLTEVSSWLPSWCPLQRLAIKKTSKSFVQFFYYRNIPPTDCQSVQRTQIWKVFCLSSSCCCLSRS